MTAPRFYLSPDAVMLRPHAEVTLPDATARHALQVLRLRDGDGIVVFDGRGGEYAATLAASARHARARVGEHAAIEREAACPTTLVQALVAHDVMDAIVRKAVELGAAAVEPVVAERSQRAPADRVDRRVARWQQVAIAACEQCGRNRVPVVRAPVALATWVQARPDGLGRAVMLDPTAPAALAVAAAEHAPADVLIGPEGGWTPPEVALAVAAGARIAHLGARTLRADTAALAALAILLARQERPRG